jgi:hypothetical protein
LITQWAWKLLDLLPEHRSALLQKAGKLRVSRQFGISMEPPYQVFDIATWKLVAEQDELRVTFCIVVDL